MNEHRLGIIGGMGPQATNTFYQYIIDRTDAHSDQEHLSVLIFSDSDMPDRTGAILGSEADREAVSQRLLDDARLLESAGCTVLAVPCNTAHYFLDQVQEQVGIPILHMIRETARLLGQPGAEAARHPSYRRHHPDRSLPAGVCCPGAGAPGPGPEAQRQIMSLIYDDIKAGKLGDPEKFAAAHQDLIAQGCDCAILACTELSVFATQHPLSTFFIDAMAVLAERAVQACRKPLRQIHSK